MSSSSSSSSSSSLIITSFHLHSWIKHIETYIIHFKKSKNLVEFLIKLNELINLLKQAPIWIHKKKNTYGKQFSPLLLISIWNFIPLDEVPHSMPLICKTWSTIFSSLLGQQNFIAPTYYCLRLQIKKGNPQNDTILPALICLNQIGRSLKKKYTSLTIGRNKTTDIQLDSLHVPKSVSNIHAVLTYISNLKTWKISDCNSSNGLFINEIRMTEHILKIGDIVVFGCDKDCIYEFAFTREWEFKVDQLKRHNKKFN